MREGGLDGSSHLQNTNVLSVSDRGSVIVCPAITFHNFRKKGEIKTVPVLASLSGFLVP